jgi:hypothetical protein
MIESTAYISRRLLNIILKVYIIIASFLLTDRLTPRRKWQVMQLSDFQPRNTTPFSVQCAEGMYCIKCILPLEPEYPVYSCGLLQNSRVFGRM